MAIVKQTITGWKWDTSELFAVDRNRCNAFFGYPKAGDYKTTSAVEAMENKDADGGVLFVYVGDNRQLREVLGEPSTFDINIEVPDEL